MNYELFLSDFDGTLVRADGKVSAENIRAIADYRAAGGIFAVVTGRMISSIRARLKELGLRDGLVVAYQGAAIAEIGTGRLLKNSVFPVEDACRVLRAMERAGVHIQMYANDALYTNRDDEFLAWYRKICGVDGVVSEDEPLSARVARLNMPVSKALAIVPPEERDKLIARLREELGEGFFVTASSDALAEVLPAGQNKGEAVAFLSEYYKIPAERVAAIGDQLNDLPMIERAGGKFAVGNAAEALKRVATVVPSAEEDGVAFAIRKYAMGENI